MRYFHNAIKFSESDVAQFRLEVINFYIKHGLTATKEAYKVGRSSIFAWKKLYADSLGNLTSLLPESTKPKIPRRMLVDPKTLEFIKTLREDNGRLGKEKIKILTDVYCTKENLKKISASKIGRISDPPRSKLRGIKEALTDLCVRRYNFCFYPGCGRNW